MVKQTVDQAIARAVERAQARRSPERLIAGVSLRGSMREAVARLDASLYGHGIGTPLIKWLSAAPGEEVVRLRPLEIADNWRLSPILALETHLQATELGLLHAHWDLVCPACGTVARSVTRLCDIAPAAQCPGCGVTVRRDLARTVELSFRPTTLVRSLDQADLDHQARLALRSADLCVSVEPGRARTVAATVVAGPYRMHVAEKSGQHELLIPGGALRPTALGPHLSIESGS
ncbi:MAG: hypothetical protein EXQ85_01105 [Alphaproteobacteria bacterium]|nr:hypothetical protein [Alphaproteobacteria bacterium]